MPSFSGVLRNTLICGSANAVALPDDTRQLTLLAHRKSQLYPDARQNSALDERVKQLPALRGPAANALLREILGNRTVKQAWNNATAEQRPDKLRALLMLVDERDIKQELALPRFNSPMHQTLNKAEWIDSGLAAVIKEYPYFPSKSTGGESVQQPKNFNGRAEFSAAGMKNSQRIVCRHLAIHQTEKMNESETLKFNYREELGDKNRIKTNVQPEMELRYRDRKYLATEVHLIGNAKFGAFVSEQFASMKSTGETKKTMILTTQNHAMSLGLRIKEKNGENFYVTKFYDPNRTNTHLRSAATHLTTIESRSIEDHLNLSRSAALFYFWQNQSETMAFVAPPRNLSTWDIEKKTYSEGRKLTSMSADLNASTLAHLVQRGFGDDLKSLVPNFKALSDQQKIQLLGTQVRGCSLLVRAMAAPTTDSLEAYAELLRTVPADQRAALVGRRDKEGLNAVGSGLKNHTTHTFNRDRTQYTNMLETFSRVLDTIPPDQRADVIDTAKITPRVINPKILRTSSTIENIMLKKHGYEESGLVASVEAGYSSSVEAYSKLVEMVPPERRDEITFAKHKQEIAQLGRASCEPETCDAYLKMVERGDNNRGIH